MNRIKLDHTTGLCYRWTPLPFVHFRAEVDTYTSEKWKVKIERLEAKQQRIAFTTSSDCDTNQSLSTLKFIAPGSILIQIDRTYKCLSLFPVCCFQKL